MSQGLSPKDHGYLNNLNLLSAGKQRRIFAVKRKEYAGDPVALQQIDVYDGESPYSPKIREYCDALSANNNPTLIAELEAWFKTNYPAIAHK